MLRSARTHAQKDTKLEIAQERNNSLPNFYFARDMCDAL